MKVFTYSERGIVDSLVYSLDDNTAPEFLYIAYPELRENSINNIEFYIEHSLSEFGNPDLLIPFNKDGEKHLIFVEAKVSNEVKNWTLQKQYNDFQKVKENSNIFWQLSLKKLLVENISKGIDELKMGISSRDERVMRKKQKRKIGSNTVVNKLVGIIHDINPDKISYLGLVPEYSSMEIESKKNSIFKNLRFITWAEIYHFAEEKGLEPLIDSFDWNGSLIYTKEKNI